HHEELIRVIDRFGYVKADLHHAAIIGGAAEEVGGGVACRGGEAHLDARICQRLFGVGIAYLQYKEAAALRGEEEYLAKKRKSEPGRGIDALQDDITRRLGGR